MLKDPIFNKTKGKIYRHYDERSNAQRDRDLMYTEYLQKYNQYVFHQPFPAVHLLISPASFLVNELVEGNIFDRPVVFDHARMQVGIGEGPHTNDKSVVPEIALFLMAPLTMEEIINIQSYTSNTFGMQELIDELLTLNPNLPDDVKVWVRLK